MPQSPLSHKEKERARAAGLDALRKRVLKLIEEYNHYPNDNVQELVSGLRGTLEVPDDMVKDVEAKEHRIAPEGKRGKPEVVERRRSQQINDDSENQHYSEDEDSEDEDSEDEDTGNEDSEDEDSEDEDSSKDGSEYDSEDSKDENSEDEVGSGDSEESRDNDDSKDEDDGKDEDEDDSKDEDDRKDEDDAEDHSEDHIEDRDEMEIICYGAVRALAILNPLLMLITFAALFSPSYRI
jgi:hypothetical protein